MLDLNNKTILVSKRIIDNEGKETFDTYFGTVKSFNENTVVVIKENKQEESLPYGDEFYQEAEDGFYELEDGSTYENPDFIAEFVVYKNEEAYKKFKWKPITKKELEALVEEQLAECSSEQKEVFNKYRVPVQEHKLVRSGNCESVFVVARKGNEVMYFEDVEEGFNFSPLSDDGMISEHWCNQDNLKEALLHWK